MKCTVREIPRQCEANSDIIFKKNSTVGLELLYGLFYHFPSSLSLPISSFIVPSLPKKLSDISKFHHTKLLVIVHC